MSEAKAPSNFIRQIIDRDLSEGKNDGRVVTRFPPEPNGYLHIGHAKSICLNFGIAESYGGACHLRFDDTNPEKEEDQYIRSIQRDVEWLGFEWTGPVRFASGYFDQLHDYALQLIDKGLAYVDTQSPEKIAEMRGNFTTPGQDSPHRDRSVEENRALFAAMRAGEFDEGAAVLRARIDMLSPNLNLRDPILYRIRKKAHHQTGDKWVIYPMYDFTHPLSDAIEGITHSLCTLEFEDHRPLYDWLIENVEVPAQPRQYEFSRLNLNFTVTSKRRLKLLVDEGHVDGWDDPRMPTLSGLRRRGYTPAAIRNFCEALGVSRADSVIDMSLLEEAVRDDLNQHAPRAFCVLNPLKLVIENWPEGHEETLVAPVHPQNEAMGNREMPLTREVYIDREDFREEANKKYKRLVLGDRVRLRYGYVVRAESVVRDDAGEIVEIRCSYDPDTLGKNPENDEGQGKLRGVIHWVSADRGVPCEVRLYDRLFQVANPSKVAEGESFLDHLNPESLRVLSGCMVEPGAAGAVAETRFQFEREGYFSVDRDSSADKPVFNRTVGLRESWPREA
ncbi:glutamine--tRNA ligase/YqeY domain fusion protein [Alloalcanivorax gelatiniphagus]|uniref:Glutamine--tRNA ligase n=1 Tax=Alloalcanivorax gelatiniphagus TaxID=1194167 RepID=A0ABY2XPX3_9GAMM|nr:glutamine--tRNA ligase/YqeY domain fusion protein [Alloalcanivorax gelatiniphagus]TMW14133.1 glutamine--tRNA ligase/YqeY domain fusion protein [Alloalcanivorax gelatiniphagus]|tara:strand:+ start:4376 stop:6058 length:1683 start_codon:yes stop_codon:yes gene_type:complete